MLASLPGNDHGALVALAGLALLAWVIYRAPLAVSIRIWIACAETVVAAAAVVTNGGASSPLLPYLLAPGLALGLLAGPFAALQGAVLASLALLVTHVITGGDTLRELTITGGQWVLLGMAVGLIAAWAGQLAAANQPARDPFLEARALLEQLRTVTRGLPGRLDASGAAEALLAEAARLAPHNRSAVLVQTVAGGALVPIAVQGTKRVPWRAPLTEPGPLRQAWETQQPVVDRREPDAHGRRRGNALAAIPLCGSDAPFGLVVLEALDTTAFAPEEVAAVDRAAGRAAVQLETALLFDEVRSVATAEERDRLAREMHDGVAQDIAFLGYQLDALRLHAAKADPELGERVGELRRSLTSLISDLRLSITDLKTSVGAERGLGAALGAYIRAISTGRQLTVHLSLQESPFRLPSDREVALFQLAQLVAQDVRQKGTAANLWVTLSVDPPSAQLSVEHDGGLVDRRDLAEVASAVERLGGSVAVRPRAGGGTVVDAVFEGEHDDPGAAGR
ncbi:MAG: histidine kinase [Actinobacteria bacterium]|nr:histidine kinase [Actinomycetota bacterium]MCA1719587.1 histidine kinase [Actinomycetota bacterium]